MPSAVHRNTDVYGEDVEVFCPERWLTPDPERLRRMEAAQMGFSRGRRSCLGQNIAVLQMKKVLPAIIMKFEVSTDCAILTFYPENVDTSDVAELGGPRCVPRR